MIRAPRLSLLLVFALGAALTGDARGTTTEPARPTVKKPVEQRAPRSRSVNFTYETYFEGFAVDRYKFDAWFPVPLEGEGQKISDLVIYSPSDDPVLVEPENGNRVAHIRSGPRGAVPLKARARCNVTRTEILHPDLAAKAAQPPTRPANLPRYLKGDNLVPIDAATKALAATITKGKTTTAQKARSIYDYVVTTMKYAKSGEGWGRGDLKHALSSRSGDCTDFNAVFNGLARASRIPARQVMGFKIPRGQREGTISEFHCWSEFYLDGTGWIPVDPVEGSADPSRRGFYFGNLDADRVAFSVGRDVVLVPPQTGGPLNFFIYPYGEGDGVPLPGGSYRCSWTEGIGPAVLTPVESTPNR